MYIKSKKDVHRETGRGKGEDIYHISEIDKNNMYDVYEGTRKKGYFPDKVEILFLCIIRACLSYMYAILICCTYEVLF